MKLLYSALLVGASMMMSVGVMADQPKNCACKDCKCTAESHCGCFSDKGCSCENNYAGCPCKDKGRNR